jgi:D-xylose 1-dehydrogenase (NADP+, D-xylono-1,5-lactone-forming)
MRQLNWGILGAARVNERLLPAIVEANHSRLVAFASRRADAAREVLQKYAPQLKDVTLYAGLEELIQDPAVEAVYIPLSNHEHASWAIKAIKQGKHVLIEKPMAIRATDIEAIYAAAKQHQVKVMEGFMYHFHPQHARIEEMIRQGLIGSVRYAKASFSFLMRPARLYRLEHSTDMGGGAMWDIGPYAIHTLRRCFDVDPTHAMAMAKYAPSGADIATSGVIDFGEGRRGHFDISFECSRQSQYTVIGDKGGITCHTVWQLPGTTDVPRISWWTDDGHKGEEVFPPSNHFNLEIDHFSECVLNDRSPALSFEDALMNCKTIEAALKSAKERREVAI